LIEFLQGGIGGLVFRQMPDGTFIVSGAPRHNKRKTPAKQKAHRQRFQQAARTARWLTNIPSMPGSPKGRGSPPTILHCPTGSIHPRSIRSD
jgi:hypothetical protein